MVSPITNLQAIDVHGHYGLARFAQSPSLRSELMTADAATVARRAREVQIEWTVVSPLTGLFPRGHGDPVAGNIEAAEIVPRTPGLLQWVIIDPTTPATFDQAREMLGRSRCVGIKIHPEEHVYPISKFGRAIFEFAAEFKAVILSHSGETNSMPQELVPFANEFPEAKLILAHIGCGHDGDLTHQVRGIQMSRHGNVFADTSSAQSIVPGLIEWAVKEVGADHVLYGTDTPLYCASMQRARIDLAELSDGDKRKILRDNAVKLLGLERFGSLPSVAPGKEKVVSTERTT